MPCLFLTSLSLLTLLSQPQLWFNSTPLPSRGAVVWPQEGFWSVWGQSVMTGLIVTRKQYYIPPSGNSHFFLVIFNTPSLNHSADYLVTSEEVESEEIRRKLFYLPTPNTTILPSPVSISPTFFSWYNRWTGSILQKISLEFFSSLPGYSMTLLLQLSLISCVSFLLNPTYKET